MIQASAKDLCIITFIHSKYRHQNNQNMRCLPSCSNGAGHSFSSGLWVMRPIIVRKMSMAHVYTSGWTDGSLTHRILFSFIKAI